MTSKLFVPSLLLLTTTVLPVAQADVNSAPKSSSPVEPTTKAPAATTPAAKDPDGEKPDAATVPQPTRSLTYKTTTDSNGRPVELLMNVFEPAGHKASDKTPVIVMFFGGGWTGGVPTSFFPHCDYFASRGMMAIAPDYRVKNRQGTTPYESVTDAKSAIRYVRAHASELGIDPNRIVASGSSAGGHIAACSGLVPGLDEKSEDLKVSSVPNVLVLYNPVIDTSTSGYAHERMGERWKEISPLHHVRPGVAPTILVHGTADKSVPYANAVAFNDAMKQAGNRCELVTLKGVGHGFVYKIANSAANRAVRETDVFLASLGYLKGVPTLPPPAPRAKK